MNIRKLKNFVERKYEAEISEDLSYHGFHHVLGVLRSCNEHIRRLKIPSEQAYLLRTAAILHDIGILWSYTDHEEEAVKYVKKILPERGYSPDQIKRVNELIMATKLPQEPKNQLENIICDADLDYLGTDKFYTIGQTLFQEFLAYGVVKNEDEWNNMQINFLKNHSYHTQYARRFREPVKQKHLNALIQEQKKKDS
jgi:uncharacterized protein